MKSLVAGIIFALATSLALSFLSARGQTMITPAQIRALPPEAAQLISASSGFDFAPIAAASCREMTFPLPGATPTDVVAPGWPSTMQLGLVGTMRVGISGMIVVSLCNITPASIDPPPLPFAARVVRGY